MKKLLAVIILLLANLNLVAQENAGLKTHKVQVTFAYPIGSSGVSSKEYSNNFSFNILYGLNGGVNGMEIGSILNYNKGEVKGIQLSGIANVNKKDSKGFLLSGVSNICNDSTKGVLISGVMNYAGQNSKGLQLSTVNIVANKFNGFQLGVFNYARKLNGIQLGVFNYISDGEKAIPIGLLSIVKNGYYEFELTGGEVIYSNLNYKMGVKKFYTIFKLGYSTFKNKPVYSNGLGFGGNIPITEKQNISIDLSCNQIVYNNSRRTEMNILNKADFNYNYSISEKFTILIGPSLNIYLTEEKVENEFGTLSMPYLIHTNEWSNGKLFMWVGINAGLSLIL